MCRTSSWWWRPNSASKIHRGRSQVKRLRTAMIGIKNHGAPLSSKKVVQRLLTHTKNRQLHVCRINFRCFQNIVNSIFLLLKVKFQLSEFHWVFSKMTGLKTSNTITTRELQKSHLPKHIYEPSSFFGGEGKLPPLPKKLPPKKGPVLPLL